MEKRITEQCEVTGKVVTGRAPKRAKAGTFDIARTDRVRDRIGRIWWH